MFKNYFFFLLFFFTSSKIFSQCIAPVPPPACNGTESLVADNETLHLGVNKWYYGSPVVMNSLSLNGGTLIVCGDLTIDKFYMDSGIVFIRPGARFVIGSGIGSGLVLKGNSSIYNYGTFEVQRNLSLDNGYATATTPNIIFNAIASSVFKMPNQYLVINNSFSWFVNNGSAEFWGIITDTQASAGSVCLGDGSLTRMAVLINKVADTYRVPVGNACLNVHQFSQFSNKLTSDPGLFACLGNSHNSVSGGCGGCVANDWGAAQVFTACTSCAALTVLDTEFVSFTAQTITGETKLAWQINPVSANGFFRIQRSVNGKAYETIGSVKIKAGESLFTTIDKNPLPGNNYYMISYIDPATGIIINSHTVKVFSENANGFTVYPIPFHDKFHIDDAKGINKIILTDLAGRNIPIRVISNPGSSLVEVDVLQNIQAGIYIIHIRTDKNVMAKTIFKE